MKWTSSSGLTINEVMLEFSIKMITECSNSIGLWALLVSSTIRLAKPDNSKATFYQNAQGKFLKLDMRLC